MYKTETQYRQTLIDAAGRAIPIYTRKRVWPPIQSEPRFNDRYQGRDFFHDYGQDP